MKGWFRKWGSLLQRRLVILGYHRVARVESDPWSLCVTPKHFTEQMDQLRKHYSVMSLKVLWESLQRNELPRRAVVITFDDGYCDNLWNGKPVLERFEIPATFFISTGFSGKGRLFWWDELQSLVLLNPVLPQRLRLDWHGKRHQWELGAWTTLPKSDCKTILPAWKAGQPPPSPRHQIYIDLHRILGSLGAPDREQILSVLRTQCGPGSHFNHGARPLDLAELRDLAKGGLMDLGSHAVTHSSLAVLSAEQQRWELAESKATLERVLGRCVTAFSYPFGQASQNGVSTMRLVYETGFTVACSTARSSVSRKENPLWLPRYFVGDWSGEVFARKVKTFFEA